MVYRHEYAGSGSTLYTYRRLQHMGHLGNQLWEIAGTLGRAWESGTGVAFPRWDYLPYFNVCPEWFVPEVPEGPDVIDLSDGYLQDLSNFRRFGDRASLTEGDAVLPMLIPVAMQEARWVAREIGDMVRSGAASIFRYRDPGIMATIGRNSAVAQLGRVHLSGFAGWAMWLGVHLVNVVSFRARILVLINWAWEYLFYDRPVRLIVRAAEDPRG